MPELYLTPTRRELLEAVHERRVVEGITEDASGHTWLVDAGYQNRKVDARVEEAQRAGWIELSDRSMPFWRLTEAGREVLGWSE